MRNGLIASGLLAQSLLDANLFDMSHQTSILTVVRIIDAVHCNFWSGPGL